MFVNFNALLLDFLHRKREKKPEETVVLARMVYRAGFLFVPAMRL